jgi:Ca-activated chloride channel homolog
MTEARRYGALLGLVLWLSVIGLRAGGNDRPEAFKGGVDLVTVDVCVRDAAGRFLPTLSPDDFLVLENGSAQRIAFLTPGGALPLRVVLVIDTSSSMTGQKLARARDAAATFASRLTPDDQLEIITFNQRASIVLSFEDNRAGAAAPLQKIAAGGMTALNEALLVAASELQRAQRTYGSDAREVVIVLSDGEDTSSVVGFDEVLRALRTSGALVYTLSLRTNAVGEWLGANWPLLQLAADTGGRAVAVPRLAALEALYDEIDEEVRHLYRLGFVSTNGSRDGKWRALSVRLRSGNARIQARSGYYAAGR